MTTTRAFAKKTPDTGRWWLQIPNDWLILSYVLEMVAPLDPGVDFICQSNVISNQYQQNAVVFEIYNNAWSLEDIRAQVDAINRIFELS